MKITSSRASRGIPVLLGIVLSSTVGAQELPPVPDFFQAPPPGLQVPGDPVPALPNPPDRGDDPSYEMGADLRHLVRLFINESLDAGSQAAAVDYNQLYEQLLARSYSNTESLQALEYGILRETLERYGDPVDRFLTPEAFREILSQARQPLESRALGTGVMYFRIPELTPQTPLQIRRALYLEDYSQGILLDLRGSSGYDPRVIADVARLFLPRSIQALVVTEDRFGQLTGWDSPELPLAAGIPLVVMVDEQTRQGAVLLAGQLTKSGSTSILGTPTAGTDRQTRFFLLPSGAAIEMAVGRWRTGENRPLVEGLQPMEPFNGSDSDWLNAGIRILSTLPAQPQAAQRRDESVVVSIADQRVGRFELGLDTRNVDTAVLGNVDSIPGSSRANVYQPNSDLKIIYIQDYILFNYRHLGVVDSFYADRIYAQHPETQTSEGIRVGSTYREVIETYGGPGEGGYNEIVPFPVGSREAAREDRYYINYDSLGLSFAFERGSNRVTAIGLYKPGS